MSLPKKVTFMSALELVCMGDYHEWKYGVIFQAILVLYNILTTNSSHKG
jgi:hypothetical protein